MLCWDLIYLMLMFIRSLFYLFCRIMRLECRLSVCPYVLVRSRLGWYMIYGYMPLHDVVIHGMQVSVCIFLFVNGKVNKIISIRI